MFYEGDLQAGINKAIEEGKLVACFVRGEEMQFHISTPFWQAAADKIALDGNEESILWENDFLKDAQVAYLFNTKTVFLCLEAGSQEASYLAAIYPLPKTPTLVIIQYVLRSLLNNHIYHYMFTFYYCYYPPFTFVSHILQLDICV